jgi:threonine/homoserine/homoserine lactone efflux protein
MDLITWLGFVGASAALLVIPGPTTLLVMSYAIGRGWRAALPTAVGVALGDLTAMVLSMLGVGAVLAASASLFTALKWIGAAYLIWLGVALWRAGGRAEAREAPAAGGARAMFAKAWIVTVLNPKSIVFFVAFLPQFIDPAAGFAGQMAILVPTFVTLAFANALGYAALGARAHGAVTSPRTLRRLHRLGGGALVGAGVLTARSA